MDHKLLEKYFQGSCSPAEKEAVENWLKKEEDLPEPQGAQEDPAPAWAMLKRRIRMRRLSAGLSIAASILFLIGVGSWLVSNRPVKSRLQWKTFGVPNGKMAELTLGDGSTVHLNGGTTLSYIDGGREVKLQKGEAFFNITTDAAHPFMVHTIGGGAIKVLGTRFNVKHNVYNNSLEITLHSGSISFAQVLLHPGEQLTYHLKDRSIDTPATADTVQTSGWRKGKLVFRDTPMPQVLSELEQHFGITFITTKKINNQLFTAELDNMSLPRVLQLIEISSNVQCQKNGDTIYIK